MMIVNGEISENGLVSADSGFFFGRGVFETILVRNHPLFLQQHCDRLNDGLARLRISKTVNAGEISACAEEFGIHDCVLKITVTEKNTVLTTRPVSYLPEQYEKGFRLKLSTVRRNATSPLVYLKSLGYTDNLLEKELAEKEGFQEVLFLNTALELAEGSVSNVFFVKDSHIFTPALDCGLLGGIVRQWVIDHFEVCEGHFTLDDVRLADELFLTNSIMGIMKATELAGVRDFPNNSATAHVRHTYQRDIRLLDGDI